MAMTGICSKWVKWLFSSFLELDDDDDEDEVDHHHATEKTSRLKKKKKKKASICPQQQETPCQQDKDIYYYYLNKTNCKHIACMSLSCIAVFKHTMTMECICICICSHGLVKCIESACLIFPVRAVWRRAGLLLQWYQVQ